MIKQYERKFQETSFANAQILRAIQLTNKVVSKRIGTKIYSSYIPEEIITSVGKYAGVYCLLSGFRKMRYNWKLGKNSEITHIDFWFKKKKGIASPDLTIDVEGIRIVSLVNILSSILKGEIEPEFQLIEESIKVKSLEEDFAPRSGGQRSAGIVNALKQWAIAKDIDDNKLETTRISYLYKDFDYWFNEMAPENIQPVSEMAFRTYILEFLKSRGLKNIYVRNVSVRKGNKEKIINTDKSSEIAYDNIKHLTMNVSDIRAFMEQSLRGIGRHYFHALILCGKAGMGKTTLANQILKEEGLKVVNMNGSIRNLKILYGLFYNNNDKNTVLLFDDVNDIWDKKYIGILNAAMDDHDPRILSFPLEVGKDIKKFKPEIEFQGKVVILTNTPKAKIPKAFFSRTVPIEIKADNPEIIDDIRRNLQDIMPEVDMTLKQELLDFLEKLGKNLTNIDFRIFKRALLYRLTNSPDWKKFVYALVN
jgi:hypothetical protein